MFFTGIDTHFHNFCLYVKLLEIGILLPKLFWPTVGKNYSSDWEKLLKFEAEGQKFALLRWCMKSQKNFGKNRHFENIRAGFLLRRQNSLWQTTPERMFFRHEKFFLPFLRSVNFKMSFRCHCFDQKDNEISLRISALASKKRLNQKMYYIKYVK